MSDPKAPKSRRAAHAALAAAAAIAAAPSAEAQSDAGKYPTSMIGAPGAVVERAFEQTMPKIGGFGVRKYATPLPHGEREVHIITGQPPQLDPRTGAYGLDKGPGSMETVITEARNGRVESISLTARHQTTGAQFLVNAAGETLGEPIGQSGTNKAERAQEDRVQHVLVAASRRVAETPGGAKRVLDAKRNQRLSLD